MDFRNKSNNSYSIAQKRGILDNICAHMEPSKTKAYTFLKLKTEALKYNKRIDFINEGHKYYDAAMSRGILDEICSHMIPSRVEPWSNQELIDAAMPHKFRVEFQTKNRGAYLAAYKKGKEFLDKICSHMKPSRGASMAEIELLGLVKDLYPNSKKFRDYKVDIVDKPYIKRFDIDIYIPEIGVGIEFDGTYWHSFEALRAGRGRSNWSDDDIKNYHQIKDTYFLESKGIRIIHIKEEDWKSNKDSCIKYVRDFLSKAST
jgi:hypothetical protein